MIKNQYAIVVLALLILLVAGCQQESADKKDQASETIVTAKKESRKTQLFFNGTLEPLQIISVTSPIEGRVAKINFNYGEPVSKDQTVVMLSSDQLAEEYRKVITNYLQRKDAYDNGTEAFRGSKALSEAGITSRESFLTDKSQYENEVLSFLQARFELQQVFNKTQIDPATIRNLRLGDTEAITKVLNRSFDNIEVKSQATGVALFPIAKEGSSDDSAGKKLEVGSEVKQGQLLLSVGDLSGLSASVKVSEINVNRIRPGMDAIVTGDAFPGIELKGKVTQVASQADPDQAGETSLSQFNVMITIPKITDAQRKIIRVGMTAKIALDIVEPPAIMIPIKALKSKDDKTVVMVIDKNGQRKEVEVETGSTSPEGDIAIVSGIQEGDKVVVDN